jgi:hypothetical protein
MLLLSGGAYWVEMTQHQPAATSVDNTRSCSYSDMLLMMGEKHRPKHVELIRSK